MSYVGFCFWCGLWQFRVRVLISHLTRLIGHCIIGALRLPQKQKPITWRPCGLLNQVRPPCWFLVLASGFLAGQLLRTYDLTLTCSDLYPAKSCSGRYAVGETFLPVPHRDIYHGEPWWILHYAPNACATANVCWPV